jgi:hypothetical protein
MDLDGYRTNTSSSQWSATVRITVVDAARNRVAGATVTGSWSAGASGTSSAVTGGIGNAFVQKNGLSRRNTPSVTFTVMGISHGTLAYYPARNEDFDRNSNGTSIVVRRP